MDPHRSQKKGSRRTGIISKAERKRLQNLAYYNRKTGKENVVESKWSMYKKNQRLDEVKAKQKTNEKRKNDAQRKRKSREREADISDRRDNTHPFKNRMTKSRAMNKVRNALPDTPNRREIILKTLLKESTDTCNTPNTNVETNILYNIQKIICNTKRQRNDEARTAMHIITSTVRSENPEETLNMARKVGLSKRRIYSGYKKKAIHDTSDSAAFKLAKRKVRSDKISDEYQHRIYNWWISPKASRASPNKSDVKKQRIDTHVFISHQSYILEKTQTEIYEEFRKANEDIQVSQRTFERLKPFFIRQMRVKDRVTCCCRKHVEIKMVFKKCMDLRRKIVNNQENEEEYPVYESVLDLVEDTLCSKESTHHKLECLERRCGMCGVCKIKLLPEELSTSESVEWSRYEYEEMMSKSGDKRRKLMLKQKITPPFEMFEYFLKLLSEFPSHNFRANWQADQLKMVQENLPPNSCLVVHDFSENYRCIQKQELQSTYFNRPEITLHVSVIYRRAILEIDGEDENNIVRELFFVLSDDQTHDQTFVFMVQQNIKNYLDSISCNVEHMIEFTDGCSVQYKSKNCMGMLSDICEKLQYKTFSRNYFETSHGKGEQDAAGGAVKRQLDYLAMKGVSIQNATSAYENLLSSFKDLKSGICKRRVFRLIQDIDRTHSVRYQPIPENRKIHQLFTKSAGQISVRNQSCYSCIACLEMNPSACENMNQTDNFRDIKTRPINGAEICGYEESEDNIQVQELISEGDIVAVYTKDDTYDYYLMKVLRPTHILHEQTNDDWGNTFKSGSNVISGLYFERGTTILNYNIIPRLVGLVYADVVFHIVSNERSMKTIELSNDDNIEILSILDNTFEI